MSLRCVGRYERSVVASMERVWENVRDWEHLPWLHASSFQSIELLASDDVGWRARIGLHGGDAITLELCIESHGPDGGRYVSRTVEGPGTASEIWTTLSRDESDRTRVVVEFHLPGVEDDAVAALGGAYKTLYTRLWDEDEAMMRARERELSDRVASEQALRLPMELGEESDVRARLPWVVGEGRERVRVVDAGGELRVHPAVCPHWLGPLDEGVVENGEVLCPWHGYRFSLDDGRCVQAPGLRLRGSVEVAVQERDGRRIVSLVPRS